MNQTIPVQEDLRYLQLLSREFPNIPAVTTELINLQAILHLPKPTEHCVADLHGEHEAFLHVLRNASGRIKWFKIEISVLMLLCLPLGYLLFRQGYPATTLLVLFILADATARVIKLILMRRLLGFDSWQYVRQADVRPGIIALLMSIALYGYAQLGITAPIYRLCGIATCFALTAALVWTIGLTQGERQKVKTIIRQRLIRKSSSQSKIQ